MLTVQAGQEIYPVGPENFPGYDQTPERFRHSSGEHLRYNLRECLHGLVDLACIAAPGCGQMRLATATAAGQFRYLAHQLSGFQLARFDQAIGHCAGKQGLAIELGGKESNPAGALFPERIT